MVIPRKAKYVEHELFALQQFKTLIVKYLIKKAGEYVAEESRGACGGDGDQGAAFLVSLDQNINAYQNIRQWGV